MFRTTKKILSIIIIALSWGFFEGFTLLYICKKFNSISIIKNPFLRPGYILIILLDLLVHAKIGHTIDISWIPPCILMYTMLTISEVTENSWGEFLYFPQYGMIYNMFKTYKHNEFHTITIVWNSLLNQYHNPRFMVLYSLEWVLIDFKNNPDLVASLLPW